MKTPDRTTAAAFARYSNGVVIADSAALQWPGLFVRRIRFPRVVDCFLVPATAEPLMTCVVGGSATFRERDLGSQWIDRHLRHADIFVTHSKTPYELSWSSPEGGELESLLIHVAVDEFVATLEACHPGKRDQFAVADFFGRDETLSYLCFACTEMLAAKVPGSSPRVTALVRLLTTHMVEVYAEAAFGKLDQRGGLPIVKLRRVEAYVRERLDQDIALETLAGLVDLSPYHFSRVFKQATGMSPLQFVTRERISRAQQLIRETSLSLIEVALEVGYGSPSHFAQIFRRVVKVTPTEFRNSL